MSLLIKGCVMPLMCEECPCYDNDDYSCNVTGHGVIEYRFDGRPDNCPLVEIPTPHGRLIDADALHEKADSQPTFWRGVIDEIMVREAPTIIEAEE